MCIRDSIRATEGTVISRIPPRVKIRENAAIELPHVMLLVDDHIDRQKIDFVHNFRTFVLVYLFYVTVHA